MNKEGHKPELEVTGTEEINTQPETLETQKEKRQVAKATLADIFRERAGFDTPLELRKLPESFENIQLPEIISANFEENLRLLHELNGHSGQQIIPLLWGKSEIAKYLKKLYNWSKSEVSKSVPDFTTLELEVPESLKNKSGRELYEFLKFLNLYPETNPDNYEKEVNNKFLTALGKNPEKHKLIDGLSSLFAKNPDETSIKRVLNEVGFIPKKIFNTDKFKNLEAPRITTFLNTLTKISSEARASYNPELEESDEYPPELQLATDSNTERAHLLNVLLNSPQVDFLRKKTPPLTLEIDSNGLYIKGSNFDFGSHLPYGLINNETVESLENKFGDLLNPHEILEVKVRQAVNAGNYNDYYALCLEQLIHYAEALGWSQKNINEFLTQDPSYFDRIVTTRYLGAKEKINESQEIVRQQLVIPDLLLRQITSKDDPKANFQKQSLISTAEQLTMLVTQEKFPNLFMEDFNNPLLLNQAEQSYRARESVVNTRKNYNTAKIAKFYLQNPPANSNSGLLAFRGSFRGESKDQGHEFLEVVADETVHRILINPKKHLTRLERTNFENIRLFREKDFSNIENRLKLLENLTYSISAIATIARNWIRYEDLHGYYVGKGEDPQPMWQDIRVTYLTACENFLAFTRANLGKQGSGTEHLYEQLLGVYKKLKNLQQYQISRRGHENTEKYIGLMDDPLFSAYYEKSKRLGYLKDETSDERELRILLSDDEPIHPAHEEYACKALCGLVEKIYRTYRTKLYEQIESGEPYTENYRSEIQVTDQLFDSNYFSKAKQKCIPGGYHKALCECETKARVVQIDQKRFDPAELLSIELEEEALEALHYNRNPERFTVIAYGGANNMEKTRTGDISVPREIFNFLNSRENKGNIICPGTQSGVGIPFALMYVDHLRNYGHLPENRRVFAMAISPSPNIVFNGNKTHNDYPDEERFGMSPIPTIALDLPAGWHIWGAERENIPYARLSARSADLMARASFNQDRIVSLSNGGMSSLIDTEATIRHNIPLLIHDGTGRSAEALATLVRNNFFPETVNPEEYWPKALEVLKDDMAGTALEYFLKKDFGESATTEDPNQILYRKVLFPLLLTLREKQRKNPNFITIARPEDTQKTLNAVAERMAEARKAKLELAKQKRINRE